MKRFLISLLLLASLLLSAEKINWQKAKKVQTGTRFVSLQLTEPRLMKVYIFQVDLQTKGLYFTGTLRDPDWGKPMPDFPEKLIRTKREKTADFMKKLRQEKRNIIVAANAAPWSPWCKPFNHKYGDPAGVGIVNGEVIWDNNHKQATFIVWKNGKAEIVSEVKPEDFSKMQLAVSGFAVLALKGKNIPVGGYEKPLHPRMAYGISADGRYLYIMAIDGRQEKWSLGANGNDIVQLMFDAGAADVINMDGGGSTTLCYWDKKKKVPVMVNQHGGNAQRDNGSNIAIGIGK